MKNGDDKVYLQDIIESIDLIIQYLGDKTEFEFSKDLYCQDAILRRFTIIGEASSKIKQELKEKHREIEWRSMKDTRNIATHDYSGVSIPIIYLTIKSDFPILREKLLNLLNSL